MTLRLHKPNKPKRPLPPAGRKLTTTEARKLSIKRFRETYRLLAK